MSQNLHGFWGCLGAAKWLYEPFGASLRELSVLDFVLAMTASFKLTTTRHDLVSPEPVTSSPQSFDETVRSLHRADVQLKKVKDDFWVMQEAAARALAPVDCGSLVQANEGVFEGRSFIAERFSIGYRNPGLMTPVVTVCGPLASKRYARERSWAYWSREFPGLLPWACDPDPTRTPPNVHVPPASREDVQRYAQAIDFVRRATEHSVRCLREVLQAPEVAEYANPVKPWNEGDELKPGGWRNWAGLRVRVERVQLKSAMTGKPWSPIELAWVSTGQLVTGSGRELGVPLEWSGNVANLRAGAAHQSWQRVTGELRFIPSSGYVAA